MPEVENNTNAPSLTRVELITDSEWRYIKEEWGNVTDVPDWVYQKAKERIILDGLKAMKRL